WRGGPCGRRRLSPPAGGRGCRLPASSQLQRRSALALRGYLAASVPSPCFARVRTWHGMPCHRKGTARWIAFERCACVRKDDRSFGAVRVRFVLAHEPSRLLTHQERAERRVSKCVERHTWVDFGNLLSKDAGHPGVDVVHDKRRNPEVSNNIVNQQVHGRRLACIARVSAHAVRLLQVLQDRFVWVSSCDTDRHAVFRKQPHTTRADAGATPKDQCDVFFGRLSVAFGGCSHASCSDNLVSG